MIKMIYYFTQTCLTKISMITPILGENVGLWVLLYTAGRTLNLCNLFRKQFDIIFQSSMFTHIHIYELVILLLGI
jgi:hypothetical protein